MIESKCPLCGGRWLRPDPPPNTKDQNIEFRKKWDEAYALSQERKSNNDN